MRIRGTVNQFAVIFTECYDEIEIRKLKIRRLQF